MKPQFLHQRILATVLLFAVSISTYAWDACINGIYYNFTLYSSKATVTYYSSTSSSNKTAYSGSVVIPSFFIYKH